MKLNKGYTIRVLSWENDKDHYNTLEMTVETKKEALAIKHMAINLWKSSSENKDCIGNLCRDFEQNKANKLILKYLLKNPQLLIINNLRTKKDLEAEINKKFGLKNPDDWLKHLDQMTDNEIILEWLNLAETYNYKLMGVSSFYISRCLESIIVYFTPQDIEVQEIK